jgi:hypothetical protein
MYKISSNIRKYSTTPIVEVIIDENGREKENIVICVTLPKEKGNVLSQKIIDLLNNN